MPTSFEYRFCSFKPAPGDFTTSNNIAKAVNELLGDGIAIPLDTNSIRVAAPVDPRQVAFVSVLENIEVEKASLRQKSS